jgi:hypothetical protein
MAAGHVARLLLLALIAASLVGCGPDSISAKDAAQTGRSITYFRDARTGLCFGAISSMTKDGLDVISITNVPCDAVRDLVGK